MLNTLLSPRQQTAYDKLADALQRGPAVRFRGTVSRGKSTVMRALHGRTGGAYLTARDYIEAGLTRDPLALEEAFFAFVAAKLELRSEIVYLDDLGRLTGLLVGGDAYPRRGYFEMAMKALCEAAAARGRKLVFEEGARESREAAARAFPVEIAPFTAEDFTALGVRWLGQERAAAIDFEHVFRYAPNLDIHQLNGASQWLFNEKELSTAAFIDCLRGQALTGNVDLNEIEAVEPNALEGLEPLFRALAARVVLPLEGDATIHEHALRHKRGVVLSGPSGTGKTTMARALAHRLRGKFLRVDGTVLTGWRNGHASLDRVLELARRNAPALIFIDDADQLFGGEAGEAACRYLLAQLDGIEHATRDRLCIMMTATHAEQLPAALTRRVEMWLETKLPDAAARARLFQSQLGGLAEAVRAGDPATVVERSQEFSAADIQRAVDEAKAAYAFDRLQNRPPAGTAYLLDAVEALASHRGS